VLSWPQFSDGETPRPTDAAKTFRPRQGRHLCRNASPIVLPSPVGATSADTMPLLRSFGNLVGGPFYKDVAPNGAGGEPTCYSGKATLSSAAVRGKEPLLFPRAALNSAASHVHIATRQITFSSSRFSFLPMRLAQRRVSRPARETVSNSRSLGRCGDRISPSQDRHRVRRRCRA